MLDLLEKEQKLVWKYMLWTVIKVGLVSNIFRQGLGKWLSVRI